MEKISKIKHNAIVVLSLALMGIATTAASTASACMWQEPECPEELLK